MTAAQTDILALVRQYGDCLDRGIRSVPGSEDEGHWITQAAQVYTKLARLQQAFQQIVSAAYDLEAERLQRGNSTYLDFCLRNRLEALSVAMEPGAPDQSLIETQEIDASAILAALEW